MEKNRSMDMLGKCSLNVLLVDAGRMPFAMVTV